MDQLSPGYGKDLVEATGITACAYCGLDLTASYETWLLTSVDHVVPHHVCRRLNIDDSYVNDYMNLVLACAGCNGFGNRYVPAGIEPRTGWTDPEFAALRDRIFTERSERIAVRRAEEQRFYREQVGRG